MADGTTDMHAKPTEDISVKDVFGIDSDMKIKGFADRTDRVAPTAPPVRALHVYALRVYALHVRALRVHVHADPACRSCMCMCMQNLHVDPACACACRPCM